MNPTQRENCRLIEFSNLVKKTCGVVPSFSHLPSNVHHDSVNHTHKGRSTEIRFQILKCIASCPLRHLQAVWSGEILGMKHRTILSGFTPTLTDCHIQYCRRVIITGLCGCLQKKERASEILQIPNRDEYDETAVKVQWLTHTQRSYEKVLIQHQRVALQEPHSDSFLSLRVSSPCTHSCDSHFMSQRKAIRWMPCVYEHVFLVVGWWGFVLEIWNLTHIENRCNMIVFLGKTSA